METTYTIEPGFRVGIFQIAYSLWHVLDLLRTQKTLYPKVEVSWNTGDPTKSAVTLTLPHLVLYFEPSRNQHCTLIRIRDIPNSNLKLCYELDHKILSSPSSPSHPLTRARVNKVIGPTYAGTSSSKLEYPGMSFELETSSGSGDRGDLVKSIDITPAEGDAEEKCLLHDCIILPDQPGKGVTLMMPDPRYIILGHTTSQDLLLELGPPLRKYFKEDERISKVWGGHDLSDAGKGSCFWNYFQFGLDFLISPSGLVTKVVAHSNIPGTPLFQRYARCPWHLKISAGELDYTSPVSSFFANLSPGSAPEYSEPTQHLSIPVSSAPATEGKKKKRGGSPSTPTGTSVTSTETQIKLNGKAIDDKTKKLGNGQPAAADAMVLDRMGEGGLEGVTGLSTSKLFGLPGLIVEVDDASKGVTSVLVYRDELADQS